MAMYHFKNNVISRAKNQNVVAKSAYNSASKLKDLTDESIKDYTKKSCDYSEILIPKNAPNEYKDREYLWNKAAHVEKRKDSQLAREIILGLPTELDQEDNIELAKEFAKSLSDEGMIVDLNIHKINSNNPHVHLLCSLRGIDDNGEFEPKRKGNTFIRDWNTKEKNLEWRKRWADIQNSHLEKHNFQDRVSHESYEKQGIDLEPTLKEGWKSRKYYKDTGNHSNVSRNNLEIKKRNSDKIKKISIDNKLNPYDYIDKDQAKNLSSISKQLKVFISPKTLMEKSNYIDDLNSKSLLISNKEKQDNQLNKVSKESALIDEAKEIFTAQANHFFKENYSNDNFNISDDEKIYLTHYMFENNLVLDSKNFKDILNQKIEEENLDSLNRILDNKDISHENILKEKEFFMNKLEFVLKENSISLSNIENYDETDYKDNDFNKVLYYSSKLEKLALADNILEQYYDNKISNIFGDNEEDIDTFKEVTNLDEKKDIVDFIDFYGEDKTLYIIETGKYNPRFTEEERSELIEKSLLVTEKLNSKFPTDRDTYITNSLKKDIADKYNVDITNSNDIKFIFREAINNEDNDINKTLESYKVKADKYDFQYNPVNFSDIHKGVNSIVYSMNEIFKERMTKYQNKQYKSKNQSNEQIQNRNKRRSRGQGLT